MKSSVNPYMNLLFSSFSLILLAFADGFDRYSDPSPTALLSTLVYSGFSGCRQQFARVTLSTIFMVSSMRFF
jgi:hypothetical protein